MNDDRHYHEFLHGERIAENKHDLSGLSGTELESNKRILFLDDRSKRIHSALAKFGSQVTIVCTVKECKKMILEHEWDEIYLDHDLNFEEFVSSDREDCGMEVVRWMCSSFRRVLPGGMGRWLIHEGYDIDSPNRYPTTKIIIHSSNAPASQDMYYALKNIGYYVEVERWQYE